MGFNSAFKGLTVIDGKGLGIYIGKCKESSSS